MRRIACVAASLFAMPALADPLDPTLGYFLGCDATTSPPYCTVQAAGFTWVIMQDSTDGDLFNQLTGLPLLEPVEISGEFAELYDSSADLMLTGLTLPGEDLYVGNLRAMQGTWQPTGEAFPFTIQVAGLDLTQFTNGEQGESFAMLPGEACADGVVPGGMAISLYMYGNDPEADGCWQVEYVDDATLVLRDFMGEQGQVEFARATE